MSPIHDEQVERFRVGDNGIEAVPERGAAGKAGFRDKKKVVILLVLFLVGGSVVAYQFLGGRAPKQAAAVSVSPLTPSGGQVDATKVESVLKRLEAGAQNEGEETLSVARVEAIVSTFDTYVQTRQVPLQKLRVNPFAVVPEEPAPGVKEQAQAKAQAAEEAQADARRNQVLEAARALKVGSILIVGDGRKAIVSGKLCRVGDTVGGLRVDAIDPECVTLSFEGETVELRLRPETDGR